MTQSLPIRFEEHAQLTKLGIKPTSIKFSGISMESDDCICVVENIGETVYAVIVDLREKDKAVRRQICGEYAIVSPVSRLVAVRSSSNQSTTVEIFDPDLKLRLKSYTMRSEVVFWKWVSPGTLALVTLSTVLHWDLEGDTNPVKIFDRCPAMASFQMIDYKADRRLQWLVLVGLSADKDRVVGKLQLFSVERKCSQLIDGHAASFATFKFQGNSEDSNLLCFTTIQERQTKFHIVEIGQPVIGNRPIIKRNVEIFFPNEAPNDFPVAMQSGKKHGVLYLITKYGYLHMYDLETATCIYINRISADTVFVTTPYELTGGIIGVNRKGQVLSVSVDESQIISYIKNVLQNPDLAFRFAARNNLKGAEEEFLNKFSVLFDNREYTEAAKIAAIAPGGLLRTQQTMQKFQQAKLNFPGQISPLLQYFGTLLDYGRLNKEESLEICRPVLLQGKKELLEKWLMQNKLECSEELGNLVKNVDSNLALSVYLRASIPNKVVECFAEIGHFEKILHYSEKVSYTPDYIFLLKNVVLANPDKGLEFAEILLKNNCKPVVDIHQIVDVFVERSLVQQCTAFLLKALKNNLATEGDLQTKLLEMNLLYAPQVADAILGNKMFSYYDKTHIGHLCEKSGLFKRALEHFTDLDDIKRIIVRTDSLEPDWVVGYFGNLSVEDSMECLKALMINDCKQNLNLCLQVAKKYYIQLTTTGLIELFESLKSVDGLFCFLGSIIQESQEEDVHFKYIKAACDLGQMSVAESICKNSNNYCPEKVKNYLKEAKLSDYMPLIVVCDRFNMIHDLVFFLHTNKLMKYLEIYVINVNPSRLPIVVGELLDMDCSEEFIKHLITDEKGSFSIEELVNEVEERNRLNMLLSWLEEKAGNGHKDVAIHNALGKIYVDTNSNPEIFLKENNLYDSLVLGKYCESRNPHLACIAFERGGCDSELIQIYKENSLFKPAAKFLVRCKNPELWEKVLSEDDSFRKSLIDQVTHSTLLETRDPTEVSIAIKAFMAAQLLTELIQLVDILICENTTFSDEPNLQNLIILTAMKVDKSKVMGFIRRFNNYSAEEIANIAINNNLFDEALAIYKKFNMNDSAMNVLMKYLSNVEEGQQFAENCNDTTVWNSLGQAQLHRGLIKDAIKSFLKAENPSSCEEVVKVAQSSSEWEDLLKYLQMAVKKIRNPFTESELIYAYAKTGRLVELEEFISVPNNADINRIASKCYECELYEAAKLLYNNCSNFSNLALTLISLKEFQGAVESARKANKIQTWKEVCLACLENKEFRFAQMCALHIVVNTEELDLLISYYEDRGFFDELITVMEIGLSQERAHMGMFTNIAILYTKYKPDKLKDHIELFWSRMNIPKVVRAAEEAHLWQELVVLHDKYEHYDMALVVMMEHPTEAWKESAFNELALKVTNHKLHIKAVGFYLRYNPLLLNNFLTTVAPKIDNPKTVAYISEAGRLELVKPYIRSVQHLNDIVINDSLNEMLIAEGDYHGLRKSIDSFDNFDSVGLARMLEDNKLMEFRRIAGLLYRKNSCWKESVDLCKRNGLFVDAMVAASESKCPDLAEDLLEWFLAGGRKDCFAACLFQCYDLFRPDVVLELAWRHHAMDLAMPFMIQITREYIHKVDRLQEVRNLQDASSEEKKIQCLTYHQSTMGESDSTIRNYKK